MSATSVEPVLSSAHVLDALNRSQAMIEFAPDGTIVNANVNFLEVMGYAHEEIVGQHHSLFCSPDDVAKPAYEQFWQRLADGHFDRGEYRRLDKQGRSVWLRATYNPVIDDYGRVEKIVKLASDVTKDRIRNAEFEGKIKAIDRSQAMIEFDTEGRILNANPRFLDCVGYKLEEIVGRHHAIFCDADYAQSDAYRDFWARLRRGEFVADEFQRYGHDGREIWIQATYNPILDTLGRPYKVVKFATDITETKRRNTEFQGKVNAIDRSQAVIEFDLRGTILSANRNFCETVGYVEDELLGQHHRMLCDPSYVASREYREFWAALSRGEFFTGRFRRIGRFGESVWIQASYNEI